MEAEFINEYISRLIANLHDLTSKNVMLETRLVMAEKVVANLQTTVAESQAELEKLRNKNKKVETPTV